MSELQIFNYESKEVKTVIIDNVIWWSTRDICDVLDIKNSSQAVSNLDEDEKGIYSMDTHGGKQSTLIVNESGLYSLIIQSRKPETKKFKKWITSEVLPSIRKTGQYGVKAPSTLIEALKLALEQAEQIEEMKPKVIQYDSFMNGNGYQKIGDVAKLFNIKPNTLHKMLRDAKIMKDNYTPFSPYEKYFKTVESSTSMGSAVFTSYLRPEGISYIAKRFNLVEVTQCSIK